MNFKYIGEIVNTHGIKGEIKIRSDFEHKKELFIKNRKLYIGTKKEEVIIENYRVHKDYDMITMKGINNINDVLPYKGEMIYVNIDDLDKTLIFQEDYIGYEAYTNNNYLGIISAIIKSKAHSIFEIDGQNHYLVPNHKEFIEHIDSEKKRIDFVNMTGLFDEN